MDCAALPILDCHQHFYDAGRFHYPVFATRSEGFEALVGDYSALPRIYLPDDYARDTSALNVVGTVWAEFISSDPVGETCWAQDLANTTGRPDGIIALVDFSSPDLPGTLDAYASANRIRCVRQHLGWHPANPLLRYATAPGLTSDAAWRRGLASLRGRNLICEIEIFAPQLPELASLATAFPDIQFVLPVLGWPLDLTSEGQAAWRRGMTLVGACPNVAVKIFGLECIFGIHWTVAQVRPWILQAIEVFGPDRCMFASHMPISKLSCTFEQLYRAYFEVIAEFSVSEQRRLLHDTAVRIYKLS
ncbi:amidohydrolase family protein [Paraburkholderia sp. RL18-101-BIB-B]|uniref:amidohydrolase family protein n=1 Tax=Paraburkholderia sp. RL18-101-BIB-B TaxID=3031634 RepID=UPI0038BC71F8